MSIYYSIQLMETIERELLERHRGWFQQLVDPGLLVSALPSGLISHSDLLRLLEPVDPAAQTDRLLNILMNKPCPHAFLGLCTALDICYPTLLRAMLLNAGTYSNKSKFLIFHIFDYAKPFKSQC